MSVFKVNEKNHLDRKMFFDGNVDIARYDKVKYPQFEKLTSKQLGFFWRPEEIELSRDNKDFKNFNQAEKHLFTTSLQRPILLDSVQGRAPTMAFSPICSLPELEVWFATWAFYETIHSRSYTHLIRNIYADPSVVFDGITENKDILDCGVDISKYYDDLIKRNQNYSLFNHETGVGILGYNNLYKHKKSLWLAINAANALEAIRFYSVFAIFWAFAESKKMSGSADIIKLIARDENIHLASTQQMLKLLPKEDSDYIKIGKESEKEVYEMWKNVIEQEKSWLKEPFKYGSIIGLNEALTCQWVDYMGYKRMVAIGLEPFSKKIENPLPWTTKWIGGSEVQPALQEKQSTSYLVGESKQDLTNDSFKGFTL